MKYRCGLVSNSSSSSFIIYKNKLNKLEEKCVREYQRFEANMYGDPDDWDMIEFPEFFYFETMMDNYDLAGEFIQEYSIPIDKYCHL